MEFVLLVPLIVLLGLVAVGFGRIADARLVVGDAAHQAARAASISRNETAARTAAQHAAEVALRDAQSSCVDPRVTVETGGLKPGGAVTAKVTCTADLSDLSKTRMPGSIELRGNAVSPVDTYRSTT
ncbi:TadE/TadG family type IV pilus assembly protein [Streptomyces sp. B15]|uniref:TadE/TadG family type IV pilus assembly protein n=1 Tax=Streptomyces sp. B15 TaxID=1537797 RepID=UPI001B37D098|nr:TadE/TadG family type IV pilus assembly protein [Streptomyces sp. B15]MBQ1121871.1 pilus assembly protein [Streptomyces sp. B15]